MLSTAEAASILSKQGFETTAQDIAKLANAGALPGAKKPGSVWVIPENAVEEYLQHKKRQRLIRRLGAGGVVTALFLLFTLVSATKDGMDLIREFTASTSVHDSNSSGSGAVREGRHPEILSVGPAECSGGIYFGGVSEPPPDARPVVGVSRSAQDVLLASSSGDVSKEIIISTNEREKWVRLSNWVRVSVTRHELAQREWASLEPESGCGSGDAREFPPLELSSTARTAELHYHGADFFTIRPGEFEDFALRFVCTALGRYEISVWIPYQTATQRALWKTKKPIVVICPARVTHWGTRPGERDRSIRAIWTWTGEKYDLQVPK